MTAFLMLSFYLFAATILFSLPSLGLGQWGDAEVRFTEGCRRITFLFAMAFFGTAFYLHSAHVVFNGEDYGLWIAGSIGAAIALFALISIFICRPALYACMGCFEYAVYRNEVQPMPTHAYEMGPARAAYN